MFITVLAAIAAASAIYMTGYYFRKNWDCFVPWVIVSMYSLGNLVKVMN